jgi:hypothetical protein
MPLTQKWNLRYGIRDVPENEFLMLSRSLNCGRTESGSTMVRDHGEITIWMLVTTAGDMRHGASVAQDIKCCSGTRVTPSNNKASGPTITPVDWWCWVAA